MPKLNLMWGTLKSWDFSDSPRCQELMKEYSGLADGPEKKDVVYRLIETVAEEGGTIVNYFSGNRMTVSAAKIYVERQE